VNRSPQSWDLSGEAREALRTAVDSFGPSILSDAKLLGNLFKDLLPDSPREASVLVVAADTEVAGMLRQQLDQHLDADSAIQLTATALAKRRGLETAACVWATSEFASALGYLTNDHPGVGTAPTRDSLEPPIDSHPAANGSVLDADQPERDAVTTLAGKAGQVHRRPNASALVTGAVAAPPVPGNHDRRADGPNRARRALVATVVAAVLLAGGVGVGLAMASSGAHHRVAGRTDTSQPRKPVQPPVQPSTSVAGAVLIQVAGAGVVPTYEGPSTHGFAARGNIASSHTVDLVCSVYGEPAAEAPTNRLWYYTSMGWIHDHFLSTGGTMPIRNGCLGNVSQPYASADPPSKPAGPYPVITDAGSSLPVRMSSSSTSPAKADLRDGDLVLLECSVRTGQTVQAPRGLAADGSNDQWDKIRFPISGWVPDSYVDSHTNGAAAPPCKTPAG
jgi:hypothetical protein